MRAEHLQEDTTAFPPHEYGRRRTMAPKYRRAMLMLAVCGFIIGCAVIVVHVADHYAQRHAVKGVR